MVRERFIDEVVPLRPKLLSYAERFLNDNAQAEDTVQEVLLKLYQMRDNLDDYRSVYALSLTITKNICLDKIRANKRKQHKSYDLTLAGLSPDPAMELEHKDRLDHVLRLIDRLPDAQQLVLKMRHLEQMTIDEIAQAVGSTPESIRVNLSRARKQIIKHFAS